MRYFIISLITFLFTDTAVAKMPGGTKNLSDSSVIPASVHYSKPGFFNRLLYGTNYRAEWSQPVKLPVFQLSSSGLRIDRAGGSRQTNSLYLRDSMQMEWVLRSVDKEVERGIPGLLQATPFLPYKKQQITAAHPYAAALVASLAQSADITAALPVYYYVAADEALGIHNEVFAGKMCMLEKRNPTKNGSATESTDTVLEKINRGQGYPVLQHLVLRVRLLDMLLGDWDRHAGNYAWSTLDSGGQKFYYVIPRDRDFALYSTGGLLPAVAKISFEPYLVGFRKKTTNLKKLNKKAWAFDKFFLKDLTRADWENTTKHFVAEMNDGVIDAAVKAMPPEIQQLSGSSLAAKLKERRNTMFENVMRYYQFISGK